MIEWNATEAQQLRDSGMTWAGIGLRFGVMGATARARLDPVYARRRQDDVNARRRMGRVVPDTVPDIESEVIETEPARKVYSVERVKFNDNGNVSRSRISLPFVSIQHPEVAR